MGSGALGYRRMNPPLRSRSGLSLGIVRRHEERKVTVGIFQTHPKKIRRFPFKYLQALIYMSFSGAFQKGIGINGRRVHTIRSNEVFRVHRAWPGLLVC